jgi:D-tyrosyl-tRNA(Tyr) deacylase
MRILLQKVLSASVEIDGQTVSHISAGTLVYVGISQSDTEADADFLADKMVNLRIFKEANLPEKSVLDVGGEILAVSQFTLYADCQKGRRPSYSSAARPEVAKTLFDYFVSKLRMLVKSKVAVGIFQSHMKVTSTNDGPMTFMIESPSHG